MLWQLGLTKPALGPITSDPNVPKNAFPVDPSKPGRPVDRSARAFRGQVELGRMDNLRRQRRFGGRLGVAVRGLRPVLEPALHRHRAADHARRHTRADPRGLVDREAAGTSPPGSGELARPRSRTDTPKGFGDAWTDPRGMFLSGKASSDVWTFLGWPGQIIPDGTVFTSGPGESIGGTPPIDQYFIEGTVAWGRHHEGHTPYPDWPAFATFSSRYLNDNRPVVTKGQRFTLGAGPSNVVGTVQATDADNDPLSNWQIAGGSGVGKFAVNRNSGEITIADALALDLSKAKQFTLP